MVKVVMDICLFKYLLLMGAFRLDILILNPYSVLSFKLEFKLIVRIPE